MGKKLTGRLKVITGNGELTSYLDSICLFVNFMTALRLSHVPRKCKQ